jgi:hypothetical protein
MDFGNGNYDSGTQPDRRRNGGGFEIGVCPALDSCREYIVMNPARE